MTCCFYEIIIAVVACTYRNLYLRCQKNGYYDCRLCFLDYCLFVFVQKCLSFGLYWFNGYTFNGNYCQWLSKECCWNLSNRDLCSVGHYCHLTVFGLTVFCFYWHSSLSFIGKEKVSAGATSLVICCLFSLWCFVS